MPTVNKASFIHHFKFFFIFLLAVILVTIGVFTIRILNSYNFGVSKEIASEIPNGTTIDKDSPFDELSKSSNGVNDPSIDMLKKSSKGEKDSLSLYVDSSLAEKVSNSVYYDNSFVESINLAENMIKIKFSEDYSREFYFDSFGNSYLMLINTEGIGIRITLEDSNIKIGDKVTVSELIDPSRINSMGGKRFMVIIDKNE